MLPVVFFLFLLQQQCLGFAPYKSRVPLYRWHPVPREAAFRIFSMPTKEELSTDPFMKQVSHSETTVALVRNSTPEAQEMISAQLSHPDGIRGFFVTYLTGMGDDTPADDKEVPPTLIQAMKEANPDDLIPLAVMNVVMPCGMITMHKDKELSDQSQRTAERGSRVLSALLRTSNSDQVRKQVEAVYAVATDAVVEVDSDISYWKEFFEKWGYKAVQKRDIGQAMKSILSEKT